jgi:Ca-activated chloride channel family protein
VVESSQAARQQARYWTSHAAGVGITLRHRAPQPVAYAPSPRVCAFFIFCTIVLIAPPAWPQAEGPTKAENPQKIEKGKYLKAETDIALVNVSVTDPYGRLVTGLEQENFRVFEDNVEQEIVRFSSEDVPISIGVIFDMSGSMADKIEKSRLAAVQFFRTANPQDEFFLINFNDRAQLASSFTGSVEELQNHLMFTAARGETALLDGIYLGLSEMKGAHNTKKALLIISDGGDNHSRYTETDIRKYAREADVATKISMELRNQYVVGYRPSDHAHDGKWRKIKVKLRPPKGLPPLTVYAKTGYYAPGH